MPVPIPALAPESPPVPGEQGAHVAPCVVVVTGPDLDANVGNGRNVAQRGRTRARFWPVFVQFPGGLQKRFTLSFSQDGRIGQVALNQLVARCRSAQEQPAIATGFDEGDNAWRCRPRRSRWEGTVIA